MQANYGENEIKSVLQKVRIFNKDIGTYQVFAITDNFDYTVKLSNGRILIKIEELQDDEKDALTPERLTAIANRFVSSNEQTKTKTETSQTAKQPSLNKTISKKKGKSGRTILIIVIAIIVIIAGIIIINSSNGYDSGGDTYQDKVMTVEEIERSEPTKFLSADGTYRENFWGDKINVDCKIKNKATVVSYKDIVVRVTYYTKTKTVLGSNDYTIYEIFPPNTTKTVELKIDNYKNVNTIGWEVISAKAY